MLLLRRTVTVQIAPRSTLALFGGSAPEARQAQRAKEPAPARTSHLAPRTFLRPRAPSLAARSEWDVSTVLPRPPARALLD